MKIDIKTDSLLSRSLIIGGFLGCLILFVLSILIFLGNAVSQGAPNPAAAEFAARVAPEDPSAYFATAFFLERSMRPEDLPKSLAMYGKAAALDPHDVEYWLKYGEALERAGRADDAEMTYRYALGLAPHYAAVQWSLGNVLIRNGKEDEGFKYVRAAAEGNSAFARPAASLAWDLFGGNIGKVKKAVGESLPVKASLVGILANNGDLDQALAIWNTLSKQEMQDEFADVGKQLQSALLKTQKFALAVGVRAQLSDDAPGVGKVTNGGFEKDVAVKKADLFDWNIAGGKSPAIGISVEQKHTGQKSLAIVFSGKADGEFRQISQTIAVRPETEYVFRIYFRSDLKAEKTMFWQVADASSGEVIAATDPIPAGSEWTPLSAQFTTKQGSEGIVIRLVREKCVGSGCRISGRVWFDDVSIDRL